MDNSLSARRQRFDARHAFAHVAHRHRPLERGERRLTRDVHLVPARETSPACAVGARRSQAEDDSMAESVPARKPELVGARRPKQQRRTVVTSQEEGQGGSRAGYGLCGSYAPLSICR